VPLYLDLFLSNFYVSRIIEYLFHSRISLLMGLEKKEWKKWELDFPLIYIPHTRF